MGKKAIQQCLLGAALLGLSLSAVAANWEWIGSDEAAIHYIDTGTITRHGPRVGAWFKSVFDVDHIVGNDETLTSSYLTHYFFNCEDRTAQLTQQTRYDAHGSKIGTLNNDPPVTADVQPDTGLEAFFTRACKK